MEGDWSREALFLARVIKCVCLSCNSFLTPKTKSTKYIDGLKVDIDAKINKATAYRAKADKARQDRLDKATLAKPAIDTSMREHHLNVTRLTRETTSVQEVLRGEVTCHVQETHAVFTTLVTELLTTVILAFYKRFGFLPVEVTPKAGQRAKSAGLSGHRDPAAAVPAASVEDTEVDGATTGAADESAHKAVSPTDTTKSAEFLQGVGFSIVYVVYSYLQGRGIDVSPTTEMQMFRRSTLSGDACHTAADTATFRADINKLAAVKTRPRAWTPGVVAAPVPPPVPPAPGGAATDATPVSGPRRSGRAGVPSEKGAELLDCCLRASDGGTVLTPEEKQLLIAAVVERTQQVAGVPDRLPHNCTPVEAVLHVLHADAIFELPEISGMLNDLFAKCQLPAVSTTAVLNETDIWRNQHVAMLESELDGWRHQGVRGDQVIAREELIKCLRGIKWGLKTHALFDGASCKPYVEDLMSQYANATEMCVNTAASDTCNLQTMTKLHEAGQPFLDTVAACSWDLGRALSSNKPTNVTLRTLHFPTADAVWQSAVTGVVADIEARGVAAGATGEKGELSVCRALNLLMALQARLPKRPVPPLGQPQPDCIPVLSTAARIALLAAPRPPPPPPAAPTPLTALQVVRDGFYDQCKEANALVPRFADEARVVPLSCFGLYMQFYRTIQPLPVRDIPIRVSEDLGLVTSTANISTVGAWERHRMVAVAVGPSGKVLGRDETLTLKASGFKFLGERFSTTITKLTAVTLTMPAAGNEANPFAEVAVFDLYGTFLLLNRVNLVETRGQRNYDLVMTIRRRIGIRNGAALHFESQLFTLRDIGIVCPPAKLANFQRLINWFFINANLVGCDGGEKDPLYCARPTVVTKMQGSLSAKNDVLRAREVPGSASTPMAKDPPNLRVDRHIFELLDGVATAKARQYRMVTVSRASFAAAVATRAATLAIQHAYWGEFVSCDDGVKYMINRLVVQATGVFPGLKVGDIIMTVQGKNVYGTVNNAYNCWVSAKLALEVYVASDTVQLRVCRPDADAWRSARTKRPVGTAVNAGAFCADVIRMTSGQYKQLTGAAVRADWERQTGRKLLSDADYKKILAHHTAQAARAAAWAADADAEAHTAWAAQIVAGHEAELLLAQAAKAETVMPAGVAAAAAAAADDWLRAVRKAGVANGVAAAVAAAATIREAASLAGSVARIPGMVPAVVAAATAWQQAMPPSPAALWSRDAARALVPVAEAWLQAVLAADVADAVAECVAAMATKQEALFFVRVPSSTAPLVVVAAAAAAWRKVVADVAGLAVAWWGVCRLVLVASGVDHEVMARAAASAAAAAMVADFEGNYKATLEVSRAGRGVSKMCSNIEQQFTRLRSWLSCRESRFRLLFSADALAQRFNTLRHRARAIDRVRELMEQFCAPRQCQERRQVGLGGKWETVDILGPPIPCLLVVGNWVWTRKKSGVFPFKDFFLLLSKTSRNPRFAGLTIVMAGEHHTSKVCFFCGRKNMHPDKQNGHANRGVKHCQHDQCPSLDRFIDRDEQGALNILARFIMRFVGGAYVGGFCKQGSAGRHEAIPDSQIFSLFRGVMGLPVAAAV